MSKNYVSPGDTLRVTKASVASGDPVAVGQLVGVAEIATQDDGTLTINTRGIYTLSVKGINAGGNSAVAVGDQLYYTEGSTPKIDKVNTGVPFGKALGAVTSGATATIEVVLDK